MSSHFVVAVVDERNLLLAAAVVACSESVRLVCFAFSFDFMRVLGMDVVMTVKTRRRRAAMLWAC